MPLGDSITFGLCNGGSTGCPGGYRVELFTDAVNDKKNITFVGDPTLANGPKTVAGVAFPPNNVGHSGWTITQITQIVTMTPMSALMWSGQPTPNIVLLHIGTNDIDGIGTEPQSSAPTRLGTLIDDIIQRLPDALLVVAQIVPYPSNASGVMTYNAAIPALIQDRASQGKHIVMVDMFTGFDVKTMLGTDNVHPNLAGYVFMGDKWYGAIKSVLP
ncbi:MAG: SGNH/GDSL hydrolase family protein [Polyangiaceae bacterium]|nr:SGNH/GDSL hydrolase family protein [Polyangiaceae bacterium]